MHVTKNSYLLSFQEQTASICCHLGKLQKRKAIEYTRHMFLMQRFISISGIKPDKEMNRKLCEEVIKFAVIAA